MEGLVFDIERRVVIDQQTDQIGISLPARPVQSCAAVLFAGIDR